MKKSFLLTAVGAFTVLGALGAYIYKSFVADSSSLLGPSLIHQGQQATYRINFQLDQQPHNGESFTAYRLNGRLVINQDAAGDLVSEWDELTEFDVLGVPVPPRIVSAMVGQSMVSRRDPDGSLEHFIGNDFPGRYLGLQIGILDKAILPVTKLSSEATSRRERDEFGQFNVEYSQAIAADQSYLVTRKWTQSTDNKSVIDASVNGFQYSFGPDNQLRRVEGRIILNFKTQAGVDIYTTAFTMELERNEPAPEQNRARSTAQLPRADWGRAEVASRTALASAEDEDSGMPTIENITEALIRVDAYRADSPGSEQQEIFQTIQYGVMVNPSEADRVFEKILSIKGEDNDSEAKSALLFGALTATALPEVADTFAELAETQCPNHLCRIQAITSLNIHNFPNASNGRTLLKIAHSSADLDIVSAAYLAVGSVASKASGDMPEVTQALLSDFKTTSPDMRLSVIQAMGNHGSAAYYPALESQVKSDDTFERSSALYSLRNLPVADATQVLVASLDVNGSDIVNVNALRALAQKALSAPEQLKVAEAFVSSTDKDVQAALTDMLLNNLRANVEGASDAIASFKAKSSDLDLKAYLDEALEDIKQDKEKDYLYK